MLISNEDVQDIRGKW